MSPPTALPGEWYVIASAPAPKDVTLIVWGGHGLRFLRKDALGQWRNMMGHPVDLPPTHWMLPTTPLIAAGSAELNQPMRSASEMALEIATKALSEIVRHSRGGSVAHPIARHALVDIATILPKAEVTRLALARFASGDPQPARLAKVALEDVDALTGGEQ